MCASARCGPGSAQRCSLGPQGSSPGRQERLSFPSHRVVQMSGCSSGKCQAAWRRGSPQRTLALNVARVPMSQSISPNLWGQAVNTEHLLCARPGDAALHGGLRHGAQRPPLPLCCLVRTRRPHRGREKSDGRWGRREARPPGVPVPSCLGSRLV